MTKEELEKATGQELIDERNYCGVDGYYGVYLDNVNAEMLERFNRLAELEQENADLKEEVNKVAFENGELKEENAELKKEWQEQVQKATDEGYARTLQTIQLTKAKEIIKEFVHHYKAKTIYIENMKNLLEQAEQFLSEVEK